MAGPGFAWEPGGRGALEELMGRGQDQLTPKGALSPVRPGLASSWRMCSLSSHILQAAASPDGLPASPEHRTSGSWPFPASPASVVHGIGEHENSGMVWV